MFFFIFLQTYFQRDYHIQNMVKKLKRGFDINLAGKAEETLVENINPGTYAFKPTDFNGIYRPKVLVNEGDAVKAGTPIFFDKKNPKVKFTAPVSGEIITIERGAKRFPLSIQILADTTQEYESFPQYSPEKITSLNKEQILESLLESGVWANIIQRPFGYVADPDTEPQGIFISAFDTSPLAANYDYVFQGAEKYLQVGIDVLSKLTKGKVYLGLNKKNVNNSVFRKLQNAEKVEFSGAHPSGNVGVHIHHILPTSAERMVWTTTPYGLQQIGKLFLEGKYDSSKIFAIAGSEVQKPQYYKAYTGASIKKCIEGNLKQDHVRFISGNVLAGEKISKDGFLGFADNVLSIIPEGDQYEFLGWILPSTKKLSFHKAFGLLSFLTPKKEFVLDTNLHGEERAFVQTGVFEQVVPMDIYPIFLLKAIMAEDFEAMESLGIYEVIEEDFALCEFIDISKIEVQSLIREGIEALQEA